ncbi:MBL fold metallo-hydrolase [Saccharopolyspora hirsuta]|uniref:MBL fold metallo-hydrolase n=1 Tax=Saccharopolyspora hirsuta TaxID=1837 RepID=UPI00332239AA
MRIHHLNCGTLRPFGGRLVNEGGSRFGTARMVCHCLLVETEQGLVLVDTGMGVPDVTTHAKLMKRRLRVGRPVLDVAETAVSQLERLGFRAEDVRHVVPTHLDLDHAGGLPDFPNAEVHVHDVEYQAMRRDLAQDRYLHHQFRHGPKWRVYGSADGERWFGFEAVRDLPGLPPDILLVPLPGHTRGHTGVAVRRPDGKWLLNAGDAYFHHGEMAEQPHCPPGLRFFENHVQVDGALRRRTQERLRDLLTAHRDQIEVFCAHDPVELDRYIEPSST